MKRQKAILVTIVMTLMLVVILAFLYLTGVKALFYIICGIFSVVGIVCADAWLLEWLEDDQEVDMRPVEVTPEDDVDMTYEDIRDSLREELGE